MPENQEPLKKVEIVKNLIKQTSEALTLGEIMIAYKTSNPWNQGATVEEKAKAKMEIQKLKLKAEDNAEFLGFLQRYLTKLENDRSNSNN